MVGLHEAHDLFFESEGGKESHTWATVASVNADGTANVRLNSSVTTKCSCLCGVAQGDRVLVLVFRKGAVVLGKAV